MKDIEDVKSSMIRKVNEQELPLEIQSMVNKFFRDIEGKYEEKCGGSSNITKYIEEQLEILRANIKSIYETETSFVIADLEGILKMQEDLKEDDGKEEKGINSKIGKIVNDAYTPTQYISALEEKIQNITTQARRAMSYRGYSSEEIQNVDEEVKSYIKNRSEKNEENLYELFHKSNDELTEELINIYEENLSKGTAEEEKNQQPHSLRADFLDELNSGISLSEQSQNAKKFAEESSKEEQTEGELKQQPESKGLLDEPLL